MKTLASGVCLFSHEDPKCASDSRDLEFLFSSSPKFYDHWHSYYLLFHLSANYCNIAGKRGGVIYKETKQQVEFCIS